MAKPLASFSSTSRRSRFLAFAPAHAPAELVELGQAEALGFFDEDDTRVRHVDAYLDDRGRDEDIIVFLAECMHDVFLFLGFELAVDEADGEMREDLVRQLLMLFDGRFHFFEREGFLDEREDDEGLTALLDFLIDELVDLFPGCLVFHQFGNYRFPILGEFVEKRDLEVAEEGEGEGAGDGGRGHGEEVGDAVCLAILASEAHVLELGALGDAEAVLLVDDDERPLLEAHVLLEESMSTHDDFGDAALDRFLHGLSRNGFSIEEAIAPGEERDRFAARSEEAREALEVLAGEDFGRRVERYLAALFRCGQSGGGRYYGLA